MNTEFFNALELLEKEKGIPKEYMLEKVEAALISAFKKDNGGRENVRVAIDEVKKDIKVYEVKNIVEEVIDPDTEITLEAAKAISRRHVLGGVVETEVKTKSFGRISAQTAKQVIIQGIREAERTIIAEEFADKQQEIITALVTKVDPKYGSVIVELGGKRDRTEAMLPAQEQIAGEHITEGDRIKVFVVEVRGAGKGPQIMLSRTHAGLVKKLFELEVPEIASGVVSITHIAREAGSRTKIAVSSTNPEVDPIGACVGPKGGRVAAVVNELKGEKIDIIKYSEDPAEFIAAALAPSDVTEVWIADEGKACRVLVPDDQLSLAIGKEGQNARLAARLTGYKIDIKPVSYLESEEAKAEAEAE
jgi:N utilization substance protein A